MKYWKVVWNHEPGEESEPILLYSEIDDGNIELRKVDIFSDGRMQYADPQSHIGDTVLSAEPMPSMREINLQPKFVGAEVTKEEFEKVWTEAHEDGR